MGVNYGKALPARVKERDVSHQQRAVVLGERDTQNGQYSDPVKHEHEWQHQTQTKWKERELRTNVDIISTLPDNLK